MTDILGFTKEEYAIWLSEILSKIERVRMQTTLKVNKYLLQHYFFIGKSILYKQNQHGWGSQVLELLSKDLQRAYPQDKGYSVRNIHYMRQFAKEYPNFPFLQVALAESSDQEDSIVQVPLAQITWYHHISLISKVSNLRERAFYMAKTAENGWSRDVMLMQIDNDLYHAYGKAINNFQTTLPPLQSDLAQDLFKDPYKFGFIGLSEKLNERIVENQLIHKITDFLLELGKGFAFVGHQYHVAIEGDDYYIDILMYHLKLHCYVVIELKAVEFIPEFVSKLNFYISAIDDEVKTSDDNPTIGLLLCTSKKNKKVEYALRGNSQPLGVAEYKTGSFSEESIKAVLPTKEEIDNLLDI